MVENVLNIYLSYDDDFDEGPIDGGYGLAERTKSALKKPSMFQVVMLNDDFTPMEFVVEILEIFFRKNREEATIIMLKVHTEGRAICGIYPKDIAETKAMQVNQYSKDSDHPLLCEVECVE